MVVKSTNERQEAKEQLDRADYTLRDADWHPLDWGAPPPRDASLFCRSGLTPLPFDQWLDMTAALDREARTVDAYVVASLILADIDAAVAMARQIEQAGVRVLEFNIGAPYGDEASDGAIVTERAAGRVRDHVAAVRQSVAMPLWVKITGQSENVAALAGAARDGGADAVVMMGRALALLPDIEAMTPVLGTNGGLGGAWSLPLTCYWLARARRTLGDSLPLIGTNGARNGADVVRFMLAGASAVEMCTAVMTGGFGVLRQAVEEAANYLDDKEMNARDIVGVVADQVGRFGDQPLRPGAWRNFVPGEALDDG